MSDSTQYISLFNRYLQRPLVGRATALLISAGIGVGFHDFASASDRINILDYASGAGPIDRTGVSDSSQALSSAISAANLITSKGEPACIYLPAGIYRIVTSPPSFRRAGCVVGDGPSQSIIKIDPGFKGDLFSWSEAWIVTSPGPMASGFKVVGSKMATNIQNALVFYDRNDQVFIDSVDVVDLHGRALYSGVTRDTSQAYMRESHLRNLRFFGDGAPGVPVVEFTSQGTGQTDATNEVRISQIDIYGARGPSLIIRNSGSGVVRNISLDALRIEGSENGSSEGDLLTIGDPIMRGSVNSISLVQLELIDPAKGFAALRITAPPGSLAPYHISVQGWIGGGIAAGDGLHIDSGRSSYFHFSEIHTNGPNITIGAGVSSVVLDGNGEEAGWTYVIDPTSAKAIYFPVLRPGNSGK